MSFTLWGKRVSEDPASRRFRRADGVLMTRQGAELVLVDMRAERYYTLNDVGAVAWRALVEPSTRAAIVEAIGCEFDASALPDAAVIERDVARLMEQLLAAGLVRTESRQEESES
jgi:hypothetical protein